MNMPTIPEETEPLVETDDEAIARAMSRDPWAIMADIVPLDGGYPPELEDDAQPRRRFWLWRCLGPSR